MQTYERFFGFEAKGEGKIIPEEHSGDSSKIVYQFLAFEKLKIGC
jgi:hypothetical protein